KDGRDATASHAGGRRVLARMAGAVSSESEGMQPATANVEMQPAPATPPSATPTATPRRRSKGHTWLALVQSLLETVVVAVFLITFLVQAFQIPSPSMERTLLI